MVFENIPPRVLPVLEAFARYYAESGSLTPPKSKDIARGLGFAKSTVSAYISILQEVGLMTSENGVTEAGLSWLSSQGNIIPISIPIAGEVKAGRSQSDTLTVYIQGLDELHGTNAPRLTVPALLNAGKTVALQVTGDSMIEEKIFDGDYVLVELFDNDQQPRDGELVIARYIPMADAQYLRNKEADYWEDNEAAFLEGPTLKYYYPRVRHTRLSPRRNQDGDKNVIIAARVVPIGRVVGVYREIS